MADFTSLLPRSFWTVRRPAPIQAAGPGQRQRRVRAARERLQPDPPEQHPHARHGGGM